MAKRNKVFFGLSNVHIAFMTDDSAAGAPKYGEPIAIPGAKTFTPSADSSEYKFYADNVVYYTSNQNNGYSADWEMAKFPDEILQQMLGWVIDDNGALIETPTGASRDFALMFQVDGDVRGRRVVYYCCTGSAPNNDSSTTEDTQEVATQTMSVTVIPYDLGVDMGEGITTATKAVLEYDSEKPTAYNNFFSAVYMPTVTASTTDTTTE